MESPSLPKSCKGVYPFKLCTTSFIYPDHIIPNVKKLGPFVDEIEVLLFESAPASLPTKADIQELAALSKEFDVSYNIHLPLDISITADDPVLRRQAVQKILQIMEMTAILSPSTYTLHLPFEETDQTDATITHWQERAFQSLNDILSANVNARDISVETLDYPFEWAEPVVEALDTAVCLDLGHLMVYGYDGRKAFEKHAARTSIIHLHGVEKDKDHLALDRLAEDNVKMVMDILRRFEGVVSLEVFSYEKLAASMEFLARFASSFYHQIRKRERLSAGPCYSRR